MSMMDQAQTLSVLDLPDSLLLNVFTSLPLQSVRCVSLTCSHFSRIALDPQLWKTMFQRDFKVPESVSLRPKASSWRTEYRRLYDESPAVLCEEVLEHKDEVWHVSFSHNGEMFATCSRDGTVQVWNASTPCTLRFAADMKARFSWDNTQYSQFNKSDTLLLVSGYAQTFGGGGMVVFDLKEFKVMNRLLMDPFHVFGAWYDDTHLLTQTIRWMNDLECISSVWLAKATREVTSEGKYAMINPFRFCVKRPTRVIMVADVPVVIEESESTSDEPLCLTNECGLHTLSTDLTDTSVKSKDVHVHPNESNRASGLVPPFLLSTDDSSIPPPKLQHASASHNSVRTKKLLIFILSEEADQNCSVGIKRVTKEEIREEEGAREGLQWPETEGDTLPYTHRDIGGSGRPTNVDYRFNLHGKIIGMALSPDKRYLYVNRRGWPNDYQIKDGMDSPTISEKIDIHVIDLVTFTLSLHVLSSHKAYSPKSKYAAIHLDVGELYVASGGEDNQGYMWDRHYGVHVRCFPHDNIVNSCAFNPMDPEMLVTVSDDFKIKIWRSRRQMENVTEKKTVRDCREHPANCSCRELPGREGQL